MPGASIFDISWLDTISTRSSPIHRLDPRVKVLTTLSFIVFVLSFGKYEVTRLLPYMIYPAALIALGDLPAGRIAKKVLIAAPFAFFIGVLNPLFDREVLVHIGPVGLSGGVVSFASIMIRFALTVSAVLILIATTGFNAVCTGLGKLGAPDALVVQLLFLYRYLFVLGDEAGRMARARSMRSFGKKGFGLKVFTHMAGQLLLRTLDRAQRIHLAMLSRGFDGKIRLARPLRISGAGLLYFSGWTALFTLLRLYDFPGWIGGALIGIF